MNVIDQHRRADRRAGKVKYIYMGCHGGVMRWGTATTISAHDSRSEEITCGWDWFWSQRSRTSGVAS